MVRGQVKVLGEGTFDGERLGFSTWYQVRSFCLSGPRVTFSGSPGRIRTPQSMSAKPGGPAWGPLPGKMPIAQWDTQTGRPPPQGGTLLSISHCRPKGPAPSLLSPGKLLFIHSFIHSLIKPSSAS
jgi:hypothetical protein